MVWQVRRESLVSQRIEVALVYRDMLGIQEAIDYLERERISREIAERVLFTERRRPPASSLHGAPVALPYVGCRRKNHVHHAIVEAALKIEQKLGAHMALTLLRNEQVPDHVAARIIARPPGQIRTRKPA
jgi:hypothetical protein